MYNDLEKRIMPKMKQLDISKVKTYSIKDRQSKVRISDFARPLNANATFEDFYNSLPGILKADDFKILVDKIVMARQNKKPVIVLMGAHVIKVGLGPLLIDAMKDDIITGLALNGAGAIHDTELAYFGVTSEDVTQGLEDGSFGMAREIGDVINGTVAQAMESEMGFGEALGIRIQGDSPTYAEYSVLAAGSRFQTPVTVHIAIGADIIHQQPSMSGAETGELSYRDFKILAQQLVKIGEGGVVLNIGSSVIMPEIFLKALTVVRNLGHPAHKFITANFDMLPQYRPRVNIVHRPNLTGGQGLEFLGHHEIMIPLLFASLKEKMNLNQH